MSLFFTSSLAFSNSVFLEENRIEQRGREQFRDILLWKEKNMLGKSGSNQYVDFFTSILAKEMRAEEGVEKKLKEQGILIGTNSNLVKYPDIYLGVSMGYFKGEEKIKDSDEVDRLRNYGMNAELAYMKNRYLLLGGVGYSELRHIFSDTNRYREREGHVFTELGRLFSLSEKDHVYPFVGAFFQKIEGQREIPANDLGLSYTRLWNEKWSTKLQTQYRHEWKSRRQEIDYKNSIGFLAALSYWYYEDLEIRLQYRGSIYHKVYQDALSLGFSHKF